VAYFNAFAPGDSTKTVPCVRERAVRPRQGRLHRRHADKNGLLEAASGGTLFLGEITEMSPAMQVKLLRVIQEKEVLPLGATMPVKIDPGGQNSLRQRQPLRDQRLQRRQVPGRAAGLRTVRTTGQMSTHPRQDQDPASEFLPGQS